MRQRLPLLPCSISMSWPVPAVAAVCVIGTVRDHAVVPAILARLGARRTRPPAGLLGFAIHDDPLSDNRGGMSLLITPID